MGAAAVPATRFRSVAIDRNLKTPIYVQLYDALCRDMQSGELSIGSPLPPISEVATILNIPQTSVRKAFEKLTADGLLTENGTAGFSVRNPRQVEEQPLKPEPPPEVPLPPMEAGPVLAPPIPAPSVPPPLSFRDFRPAPFNRLLALEQIDLSRLQTSGTIRPFRPGLPDTREFPFDIWEGLRTRLLRDQGPELLDRSGLFGFPPLCEALAARLRSARGVRCSSDQIIVCAGLPQALSLIINTIISPADPVGMEEPGHYEAKAAMIQAGARVVPMLVDDEGMVVPDGRRQKPPVLIYTTPGNQFPLGVQLSGPRRQGLLAFARATGTWIIENDSDGDFSYSGQSMSSLQGMEEQSPVIYLGTTGKTLFPSLELAYLAVPMALLDAFTKTRAIMGGQPSLVEQATLAAFLSEGHFNRHVQRMNLLYYGRLQALTEAVGSDLADFIDLEPVNGGLHAVGLLRRGVDEDTVATCAATAGIELPLLSSYGNTALVRPGVVFGFAAFTDKRIRQTVRKLADALNTPHYRTSLSGFSETQRGSIFQRLFRRV
jgi:GntR family transcriptional regulator / MocR family aminotransferase